YNSSLWDFEKRGSGGVVRTETVPHRPNNAGMGFIVTLGELVYTEQLTYVAPDGSEHSFKSDRLHFGFDTRVTDDVLYARDGSYLRMVKSTNEFGQQVRTVDSPDGVSREFVCTAECSPFRRND